ncbi:MAG: mechanosensitive ion channel protein MscS [Draconibacterium sp.]|nr:MAG: mechanosensitive ion channel protein MscS [Draconibacterium sp.]
MDHILRIFESLAQPTVVLLLIIILLFLNAWFFKKINSKTYDRNIAQKAISFVLILIGILAFILVLPMKESYKAQILSFLGIIISAGIALSSTTILGNIIAGLMNNSMNRFRNGDLIKIGDMHGRVIRKSIFHTEIQLQDSNFITIPNLFIANNPVKLIRKNNTVISTSVSLGYDISHNEIEAALKAAALSTGLNDPYVYVTSLGDFSVVYMIHGFLDDSSSFFTTTSKLNENVLDELHRRKIEIVSPTFMNQRRVENQIFIPKKNDENVDTEEEISPENLIFDEAIKSEKTEIKKDYIKTIDKKQEELKNKLKGTKDKEEKEKIKSIIKRNEELKDQILTNIELQLKNKKA